MSQTIHAGPPPQHLRRYPCAMPFVGSHYRDKRHKRLLVIGESHYFPKDSCRHLDPDRWYEGREEELSDLERAYIHTRGVVDCHWDGPSKGRYFRNIRCVVSEALREHGMGEKEEEAKPGNWVHVAFCNYFLRPAPSEGGSIKSAVAERDQQVADEVLRWIIASYGPELVTVVSVLAGAYAARVLRETGIPHQSVPHATGRCPWWTKRAAKYGNRSGRELFLDFLRDQAWVTNR